MRWLAFYFLSSAFIRGIVPKLLPTTFIEPIRSLLHCLDYSARTQRQHAQAIQNNNQRAALMPHHTQR